MLLSRFFFFLFLLHLVLPSISLAAQGSSQGFGLELYPHYSNNRLLSGGLIGFREAARIVSLERIAAGYGLGVFYEQKGEKIGYQVGLRYLYTGYDRSRGPLNFNPDNPNNGPDFSATFRAQFIEMPFYWNFYQALNDKSHFFFSLGLAGGVHLGSKTMQTTYLPQATVIEEVFPNTTYRGFNVALVSALGFRTIVANRFALSLQPNFEYWLRGNALEDEDQLNRNLYNFGIRIGLVWLR